MKDEGKDEPKFELEEEDEEKKKRTRLWGFSCKGFCIPTAGMKIIDCKPTTQRWLNCAFNPTEKKVVQWTKSSLTNFSLSNF
ncbi:hypothetical protein LSTR_LSTR015050 [Laodelphax striatellus]|nr:hypothetical protein LSTR_LSTR015050 [Laodelphax striatellus]